MQVNVRLLVAQSVALLVIFVVALFVPAGALAWPAGWIFLALFFAFFLGVNAWLFKHNPSLLQERMRLGASDQEGWDKWFFPLVLAFFVGWLILMPLDAVRFQWSHMPVWLQGIGVLTLLFSFYVFFLTFRENSYLSSVVRLQEDRGHAVISTGPYHYVRHPMYVAFLLLMLGTPLLLGSWYGVLVGLLFMVVLARRAVLEERMLREKLPGYTDYMAHVRYRLIPYLW